MEPKDIRISLDSNPPPNYTTAMGLPQSNDNGKQCIFA